MEMITRNAESEIHRSFSNRSNICQHGTQKTGDTLRTGQDMKLVRQNNMILTVYYGCVPSATKASQSLAHLQAVKFFRSVFYIEPIDPSQD